MKTIPVSFLVAGVLLPSMVFSQSEKSQESQRRENSDSRGKVMGTFAAAWKRADTDQNGVISMAEFSAMPRIQGLPEDKHSGLFARFDKNGDKGLSRDELDRFGKARGDHGAPMKRLWELDVDKSGGVSFGEFTKGQVFQKLPAEKQNSVFKHLDTDGDGVITPKDRPQTSFKRQEMNKRHSPSDENPEKGAKGQKGHDAKRHEWIIRKFDGNQDGELSFEEFRISPDLKGLSEDEQEDRFEKLDRNQDLRISADDFSASP
jgi:Ca2+-binding EF-hand superfamily protein